MRDAEPRAERAADRRRSPPEPPSTNAVGSRRPIAATRRNRGTGRACRRPAAPRWRDATRERPSGGRPDADTALGRPTATRRLARDARGRSAGPTRWRVGRTRSSVATPSSGCRSSSPRRPARSPWYPVLDLAMTEFRVRDVFGRHTPLIGLPGRIGEYPNQGSHPGPLSFYLLAPTYRLLGSSSWALEVGGDRRPPGARSPPPCGSAGAGAAGLGVAAVGALLVLVDPRLRPAPADPAVEPVPAAAVVDRRRCSPTGRCCAATHRCSCRSSSPARAAPRPTCRTCRSASGWCAVALARRRGAWWRADATGRGSDAWSPGRRRSASCCGCRRSSTSCATTPGNIRKLVDHFGSPPEPAIGFGDRGRA